MKILSLFFLLLALGAQAQTLPGTGVWAVTEVTYDLRNDSVTAQYPHRTVTVTEASQTRVAFVPNDVPALRLVMDRLSANSVEMGHVVWFTDYADGVYHFMRPLVGNADVLHIQTWQRIFGPQYATITPSPAHEND
jgi:hypothetical protein